MSHRAALYRLQIRPKRQVRGWCLLGDYDEAGTWVGETIQKALVGHTSTNYDRTVEATFGEESLPHLPPNTVGVQILSGKSGVSSVLTRGGLTRFVRTPDDSEVMRSAALFSLPPHRTEGWLVVHVPHRRGCKTILHDALRANFGKRGYVISITPFVPEDAFRALIEQARVSKVTLTKRELERSDRFAEAAQWGDNKLDRIELTFRGRRLRSLNKDPIRRFLAKPSEETRNRIIEFGGLQFDDAAVTVAMPRGGQRTFHLESHQSGHPFTVGLRVGNSQEDEYGIDASTLSIELQRVLREVGQGVLSVDGSSG